MIRRTKLLVAGYRFYGPLIAFSSSVSIIISLKPICWALDMSPCSSASCGMQMIEASMLCLLSPSRTWFRPTMSDLFPSSRVCFSSLSLNQRLCQFTRISPHKLPIIYSCLIIFRSQATLMSWYTEIRRRDINQFLSETNVFFLSNETDLKAVSWSFKCVTFFRLWSVYPIFLI